MTALIRGKARLLGDDINTDLHCSSKYHPGRDNAYVAQRAFEQLAPGFAGRLGKGDVIVAVDDQAVGNPQELTRRIAGTPPGTRVRVGVVRDGTSQTIPVELGRLPDRRS